MGVLLLLPFVSVLLTLVFLSSLTYRLGRIMSAHSTPMIHSVELVGAVSSFLLTIFPRLFPLFHADTTDIPMI